MWDDEAMCARHRLVFPVTSHLTPSGPADVRTTEKFLPQPFHVGTLMGREPYCQMEFPSNRRPDLCLLLLKFD